MASVNHVKIRAARCTENIGASRFRRHGSGFDSRIPDFGSVRTLRWLFKIAMVEMENNLSFEASDSSPAGNRNNLDELFKF